MISRDETSWRMSWARGARWLRAAAWVGSLVLAASPVLAQSPLVFRDVSGDAGVAPVLQNIRGHGAGWGDVDGDGWLDLYVGTFHTAGTKPGQLLRNQQGRFRHDAQSALEITARATGVVLADFDNDGDLDLYVGSMPKDNRRQPADGVMVGCSLFANDGSGRFTNISAGNGACPTAFGGRSAAVLDFDGDGLLDLLVGEDPHPGYNGSPTASSRLFRNLGGLQFADVTREVGIEAVPGLGVAAADVNNDGWPDVFVASSDGGNRLFLNDGRGAFRPAASTVFAWPAARGDNMCCGVAFGDVNRDGWLDVVLGQHFERPWQSPVANRLYLHRGVREGEPVFEDVTESAGLTGLPMKAPHVEIQDFDNDGWCDISTSLVKFGPAGEPHPVVFRQSAQRDGLPQFTADALAVNDFPTDADQAVRRSGDFFDKMLRDRKVIYAAPGPVADFDNDGRLDMFLASWWTEAPSLLLRNESSCGNWLQVQLRSADPGVNRHGIGSRITIYPAGQLERADRAMLGCREMAVGFGYASGQPAIAHFGLGQAASVDLEIQLPHGKGLVRRTGITANQRIVVEVTAGR